MSKVEDPTVITLNDKNTVEILSKYVEVAQQKGAYLLQEAEVLKRACDVLLYNIVDKEINKNMAKQLLIQGVVKGQTHGAYSLNDASLLHKVIMFVSTSLQSQQPQPVVPLDDAPLEQADAPQPEPQVSKPELLLEKVISKSDQQEDEYDLSDLAEPIPLKPKEV
jgi:hypothetical protein